MASHEFEQNYCKDFICCGVSLANLHDVLQHYEECHVKVEDDETNQDLTNSNHSIEAEEEFGLTLGDLEEYRLDTITFLFSLFCVANLMKE